MNGASDYESDRAEQQRAVATGDESKLLLVDFRSGEAVDCHPDLVQHLRGGWRVHSAAPRIVATCETKLLVVLKQRNASNRSSTT